MKRFLCGFLVAVLVTGGVGESNAQSSYMLTPINGFPYGVNDAGQIVGSNGAGHSFLLSGGQYTTFDPPGSISVANGINDSGDIVGSIPNGFFRSAYLLSEGAYTTLTVPGSGVGVTDALGINNSGQIVGLFVAGNPKSAPIQGFLLSGGTYTTVDLPGARDTVLYGINNSGQIVGVYESGSFVLSGGSFQTLVVPGSELTTARGINNRGQIVGWYEDSAFHNHGFMYSDGSYTTLDFGAGTTLYGINDAGQIIGISDAGGFLATPTPEPSTVVLLGVFGLLFGYRLFGRHPTPAPQNRHDTCSK